MDLHTYLRQTLKLDESVDSSSEQPLLGWLTESLAELNLATPLEVVPVATSDLSHKYLRLSKRSYLIWDMALNRTLWELFRSLQYHRMAHSLQGSAEAANYEDVAAGLSAETEDQAQADRRTRRLTRTYLGMARMNWFRLSGSDQ